jgi:ribonuclease BN (tRNA processing enzyme)
MAVSEQAGDLRVTVLGCCGSYPGPAGACSGYLVRGGGTTVWMDAGSGSMANLQRHVTLHDVDAVILSHEHPDHWSDIEGFRVACAYVINRNGVPVYTPAGLRRLTYDFKTALDWNVVADGDRVDIGALAVTFSRTDHGPETLAARIDHGGRSLGYTSDTGPAWSLEALGAGLDLALCEATFSRRFEGKTPGHLSGRQAGEMARASGVGRLVVTHLWPTEDPEEVQGEAADAYGAPVLLATMHEEYTC